MAVQKESRKGSAPLTRRDMTPANERGNHRAELPGAKEIPKPSQIDYLQLLNHDIHGVRIINKNYTVSFFNETFADMSGVKVDSSLGKKCYELFPSPFCHTPDCRVARIIGGEKFIHAEVERIKTSGQIIPCIVKACPLHDDKNKLIGVIETFTDISEKRQLEGMARESEERYRALIELSSEAGEAIVMLQDIDGLEGVQTYANDQWIKMTGYTREELIGTSFFDLVSNGHRQDSIKRHRQKLAGISVPGLYEISIVRKDGTEMPGELTGSSTMYMGKLANVIYIRDISQRKHDEEQIREAQAKICQSEERYRSLFEDVPVAIWELDYSDVKKYIDHLRTKGINDFESYFNDNPDDFYYCFNLRKIIGLNNAVVAIMGAESKEQAVTEIQRMLESRPTGLASDQKNLVALTRGETKLTYQAYDRSLKGKWHHLSMEFALAPECKDTWARLFLTCFDITKRVEAENILKKYQEHLEEKVAERTQQLSVEIEQRKEAEKKLASLYAIETKTRCELEKQISRRIEFTRMLVHELKPPLSPMLGSSEILVQSLKDDNLMRIAMNIHRGALDLSNRIADLIDFNQGEMGIITLVPERVRTDKILKEIADYVRPMAERKGQQLLLDLQENLPMAWIDTARLRQITLNLLENAFRYTPKGGQITLKAMATNKELLIQIIDTGCGISRRAQEKLFEPYPTKRGKDNRQGLGIGLPLCKLLVELHGGKISVQSSRRKGSTFTFSIPLGSKSACKRKDVK
jgi:PAS domain S-box-containing protein